MLLAQLASTHWPPRTTLLLLVQDKHLFGPAPEQLAQFPSQVWHVRVVPAKNWFLLHVGRQRPLVAPVMVESTGLEAGQAVHWLNEEPSHEAQSGWHFVHALVGGVVLEVEVKVPEGHVETHVPSEASRLPGQVRQKSAEPAHVPQELEQAKIKGLIRMCFVNGT